MGELRFEWDDDKDALNQAKHEVAFEEARTVFFDPHALVIDDPDHSATEERFIILGHSRVLRLPIAWRTATAQPRRWSGSSRPGKRPNMNPTHMNPRPISEVENMADELADEYDFTAAKPNPYSKRLKKQVTIRLDVDVINYFKALAGQTGVPYQSLINLYLADCAANERELALIWT